MGALRVGDWGSPYAADSRNSGPTRALPPDPAEPATGVATMVEARIAGRFALRASTTLCLGLFLTVGTGWGISRRDGLGCCVTDVVGAVVVHRQARRLEPGCREFGCRGPAR